MQAYVILMTFLSVGLLLALGWALFSGSTYAKKAEDAVTAKASAEDNLRKTNEKLKFFELMLGSKTETEAELKDIQSRLKEDLDVVAKKYEADMSLFGPNVSPQERNYSKLVQTLMSSLRERNVQQEASTKQLQTLQSEVDKIRAQETAARKVAEDAKNKLEQELTTTRQNYKDNVDAMQREIDGIKNLLTTNTNKSEAEKNQLKGEIARLTGENKGLIDFKREMMKNIEQNEEREDFESAQGRIITADKGGVLVWVNLGKQDGLIPGRKFSVFNEDTLRISEARPKAQIEITRVDDNMSMGRVLSDRLAVPVIAGDLVYSPMFQQGRKTKFALLGRLDIDGNGTDDRELVRSMIEQNGGEVVEELGPNDGKSKVYVGKGIDANTRYLVVGEELKVESLEPGREATRLAFADLEKRANYYEVTRLSMDKLVGLLKKYDDDRAIPLGDGTRAGDFRSKQRSPESGYLYREFRDKPASNSPTKPPR
jgi:hypothetical protein